MDVNAYTAPFMLTKSMQRDVYPAVDPKNPELSADKKVVVVFGASGGIGFAVAKAWISASAKGVVLVARNKETLDKAVQDLDATSKSNVISVTGDISSLPDVEAVFKKAVEKFGQVDVVVNLSSISNPGPIGGIDPAVWWHDFEVNLKGTYNIAHSFINASGGKGTLINLVSLLASMVVPGMSSYAISKLALIKFGEHLDLEHPNLRVFAIHPGVVAAENGRGVVIDAFTPFAIDTAALTAGLSLYLATPKADFLKGSYIHSNWDVTEMEEHKSEIVEKKLTKLGFLNGQLQPGGYPWSS